jgi:glycosyltransferase involved in cell wall biosynthesis
MHVVGNSLDYEVQKAAREDFEASISGRRPRIQPIVEGAYFLAVARLVRSVEMSLAIEAMAKMPPGVTLVIVGAGPERESLEAQAVALNVPVRFLGPIYDEAALASLFSRACAVVSPGKVGLLALHALAYGAPVITHGDLDHQMPEVEAITPGITGAFYRRGDAADLADKMAQFLCVPSRGPEYDVRRASAISMIEENYTPEIQVKNITTTLNAHF